MSYLWVIFSYFLGSIPFGYIISYFSGKNVLEIGWRKTSGSNVFKNVGKWQGVLTGLLDISKGYLAVFGAQKLGFTPEVQIFSGIAAICGHNWSCFLKFSGGRGIGTLIGAFFALSFKILVLSLLPFLLMALIWNAAIGTLFLLLGAILFSIYFKEFNTVGVFIVLSLLPVFTKRLSPIEEIKKSKEKKLLIFNRIIFDNDKACLELRIKSIAAFFKKTFFPKKKRIEKIGIEELRRMMVAAAKKVVTHQEEINKINVWPVADKDTGYNLAATLLGIEGAISLKNYSTIRELTQDIKEAAMMNARGNAGMIYTGYIIEFLDRIKHLDFIDAFHLAFAMKKGIGAAKNSVINPVEGTILDVIKAAGEKSFEVARYKKEKNIIKVLEMAQESSKDALKLTKEKLKILKDNDVVDAGGLGFVKILEGWIEGLKNEEKPEVNNNLFYIQPKSEEKLLQRYEVVSIFKKIGDDSMGEIKKELSPLGDSLDIIELEDKIKIHIHTNEPDMVLEKIKKFPEVKFQIEDMQKEIEKIKKKPLGLVVDEIADLPEDFLEKNNIIQVPFTTRFPDGEIIISKEEIYSKMREAIIAGKPLPTTSAPSFKDFFSAYQTAFEKFEKILVITVSSKLSGTYSAARIARSMFKKPAKLNIFVFDCNTGETAEGLIAMKAQELVSQGKNTEEIIESLKKFCPKVTLVACLEDFKYVVHGGRVKIPKFFIKPLNLLQKIGIKILIALKNGKIKFLGIRYGKNIAKVLAEEINWQRGGKPIKVAIAYADNLKEAQELKEELEKNPDIEVLFISSVSPVVGTHTGPGTLLASFYPVDS